MSENFLEEVTKIYMGFGFNEEDSTFFAKRIVEAKKAAGMTDEEVLKLFGIKQEER